MAKTKAPKVMEKKEKKKKSSKAAVETEVAKTPKVLKKRGKKYISTRSKIDTNKLYSISDAVGLVKETAYAKFDAAVELHLVVKKEGVNVNVALPHSSGKQKKVEIADEATVEKLKAGKIDFDILLATADMMPKLVPFAKTLGPKGLMPNPRNGTLIKDKSAIKNFSGNSVNIKGERKAPLVHTVAGKVSQKNEELEANIGAIINAMGPKQVQKAYLSSTMGPSVKLVIS